MYREKRAGGGKPGEVTICTGEKRTESQKKHERLCLIERETGVRLNLQAVDVEKVDELKYLGVRHPAKSVTERGKECKHGGVCGDECQG